MNILFIGLHPPHIGGIATHTYNLKVSLESLGHNVHVLTYNHKGSNSEDVHMVNTWSHFRGISFIKNAQATAKSLIEKHDIDIIHSHYMMPPGYVGSKLSKKYGIPHVVTAHGSDINFLYMERVGRFLINRALHNTNGVICVSKALEKKVSYITDVPTYYIPNGVDTSRFSPSDDKKEHIIYVGSLTEQKKVSDIIDALRGTDEKLVIVGDGPQRPRLKWLASHRNVNTSFVGYSSDVPSLLNKAKALVLPSQEEGFGLTILEAMASGVPAIGRNTSALREIIDYGENGLLFSDVDELTRQLHAVTTDDALRKKLIKNGLKTASKFTWRCVANRTEAAYNKIINKI